MKKAIIYFCLAIFLALVVQPNIASILTQGDTRVPVNTKTGTPATNENIELKGNVKKQTICIDTADPTNDDDDSKTINWEISNATGKKLEEVGFTVVYTKSNEDETVTDEQRLARAKESKSKYLLSIATTSNSDTLEKGYSIMTQDDDDLIQLSGEISGELESINYSQFQGLDTDHYANFSILKSKKVKAVLLEIGYVTNKEDLANLKDKAYQKKIAGAIAQAFLQHLND